MDEEKKREGNWWRQYTRGLLQDPEAAGTEGYEQYAHRQIRGSTSLREKVGIFWQFTKFFFAALLLSYQLLKVMKPKKRTSS